MKTNNKKRFKVGDIVYFVRHGMVESGRVSIVTPQKCHIEGDNIYLNVRDKKFAHSCLYATEIEALVVAENEWRDSLIKAIDQYAIAKANRLAAEKGRA